MTITKYQDILDTLSKKRNKEDIKPMILHFYGNTIEVKQYLPIQQKIELIQFVTNISLDDNTGFVSPVKRTIATGIAILQFYAGINFDLTQNLTTAYDTFERENLIEKVKELIPEKELNSLMELLDNNLDVIQKYNTSAAGIAQAVTATLDDIVSKIKEQMDNLPESVKETLGKKE